MTCAYDKAAEILDGCREKGIKLTTAESCTGGMLSALLTEIPGSSDVVERGFITYSNAAKTEMLGVDAELTERIWRCERSGGDQPWRRLAAETRCGSRFPAVAVTGIAPGPRGGTAHKPVGLVYVSVVTRTNLMVAKNIFSGNRTDVRIQSVAKALDMLRDTVNHAFIAIERIGGYELPCQQQESGLRLPLLLPDLFRPGRFVYLRRRGQWPMHRHRHFR